MKDCERNARRLRIDVKNECWNIKYKNFIPKNYGVKL